ncbi:nitrate reductase [Hyphomicrobium sp. MC1]|uniref:nitrate reductase n=1 Tax=Hyphomicrobium sp. (strain MC1) TaxID=717785 RepID=UPI000213E935|nr:nitrate reductase [Hyphomicrobium sp. MC1]CCB67179.1 nitrate reductase, large subunit [Hyphomicrobium sp. MC1]
MAMPQPTKTTCPYCGVGCGVLAEASVDGTVAVSGDPDHPANFGRLCSKGSALGETVALDDRLLYPEVGGRRVSWNAALELVASGFSKTIAKHGPDSVAFYVSGQLLTEDYYVANKLMKGFIGSANIDTNSRLCMASSVAGHKRAFGTDTVPGCYEDLECADLIVLVGSNLAWCHPVLYQRIVAAKEKRPSMKIVLIDPRRTMTADLAEMHLPIKPDGDVALFVGLLNHLADVGAIDDAFVSAHTSEFEGTLNTAQSVDALTIVERTGLSNARLKDFFDIFARTEKVVTIFSQGVNQSSCGTDKVNAIINCHLATGRIGKPGIGPFSVTGQPNAMGGREVGGLANTLAAHMEFDRVGDCDRVQRFWQSPVIAARAGLKAVDMFRAVADGRIKAIWIMATNPVVSMPDAGDVEDALRNCPFVVVSDVIAKTDTVRHAHVTLPAAAWGEKSGTVTNSERRISRQRSFLPLPGEAQPDWWIMCEVAKRMGFGGAFAFQSPSEIFAEHAALSAFENEGTRDFDIGAFSDISGDDFDALEPCQWPRRRGESSRIRFFADGNFFTPDRKARFVATKLESVWRERSAFPLTLNTGRIRDHWHTLTRTGKSQRLSQHYGEPFAEIHPDDAKRHGIADADLVRVSTGSAAVLVRALISARQQRGSIFVPMHWTDQFASKARVDMLVPSIVDPISGQPAAKNVAVRIERFVAETYGFAVLARKPEQINAEYWALAKCDGGWRIELGFASGREDWAAFANALFGSSSDADTIAFHDCQSARYRFACYRDETLLGAVFLAPEPVAVSRDWAVAQLATAHQRAARFKIIAGRPGAGGADKGATVCSCFGVGANDIAAAARRGCRTVAEIGETLQAGTNCGSCRAEIKTIIEAQNLQAAE